MGMDGEDHFFPEQLGGASVIREGGEDGADEGGGCSVKTTLVGPPWCIN